MTDTKQEDSVYIESININLFGGIFQETLKFENGLNVLCGENGTCKTKVLFMLQSSKKKFYQDKSGRIVAFNPKRNAEKQNLDHFIQKLRRDGFDSKKLNQTLAKQAMTDLKFSAYPSFSELFIVRYETIVNEGSHTKPDAVKNTEKEFNEILKQVFPGYYLTASWENRTLLLKVGNTNKPPIPIDGLSCGENEVFSLIFNIYANRDEHDVYLIDEPEIHLNWHLEEGLFNFLNWFSKTYNKQIIVATHSRAVFHKNLIGKAQFLVWDEGKIKAQKTISDELKNKISGEAVKIISALELSDITVIIEDDSHRVVIEELAEIHKKKVGTNIVGGSGNVKSLCKAMDKENVESAFFMVDGDNVATDKDLKGNSKFIHLKKYCIENYFLEAEILSELSTVNKTKDEIELIIKNAVKSIPSDSKSIVYKTLAENDLLQQDIMDTFDASKILEKISRDLGFTSKYDLMRPYIKKANEKGVLKTIFGEIVDIVF